MPAIDHVRIVSETYDAYESGDREMVEKHLAEVRQEDQSRRCRRARAQARGGIMLASAPTDPPDLKFRAEPKP